MRKILALTITKDDTTSFYRAAGVMRDIVRRVPNLTVDIHDVSKIGSMTWSLLAQYDAVFLQRPYTSVPLMNYLRDLKIPIWVDYDDNLFQIPECNNRAFDSFMDETVQKNMVKIGKMATVITVSTGALKEMYDKLNNDVRVIPNALPFEFLGNPAENHKHKTMFWRGGDSHRLDLRLHELEMAGLMEKYKEWEFVFAGFNPYQFASQQFKNKKYRKPEDPLLYFKWLREYAPQAMWVPLHDSFFNRCKSNIAALEGTYSGAVCLVPDWPEWQIPGTLKYKTQEEFAEKAEIILKEQFSVAKYRGQAMEYIRENYDLAKVNQARVDLVNELLG
jgi:hypothetical protein